MRGERRQAALRDREEHYRSQSREDEADGTVSIRTGI
jgi:hypothetical protein